MHLIFESWVRGFNPIHPRTQLCGGGRARRRYVTSTNWKKLSSFYRFASSLSNSWKETVKWANCGREREDCKSASGQTSLAMDLGGVRDGASAQGKISKMSFMFKNILHFLGSKSNIFNNAFAWPLIWGAFFLTPIFKLLYITLDCEPLNYIVIS